MLKVGDLTQNQSNSIFTNSDSIQLTPIVSAEWNQNLFNPPYLTVSGDGTKLTVGSPTGSAVTNVTNLNLVKPNFTTKSITTSSGTASITYPITANSKKAYKVVFFAKTNQAVPLMISAYADGTVNGSSSEEINSFGWTKIETYVGSTSNISSFNYVISVNRISGDDVQHTVYFSVPEVYETTYFDYQYHSVYPTNSAFINFRPGESYITTGNINYISPSNFRRIKNKILNSESLSGDYYGDKYMPTTPIISNPNFTLATIPVPVYKNILVSDMSPYKYFVSDISSNADPTISAIYESSIYSNKIVIKFNTLMAIPSFNLKIDGTLQTVDSSTTITPNDNGDLTLYWTGSAWTQTKWSTMPTFDDNGSLTKYTTISKITVQQISTSIRSSFTSYNSASTYVASDLTRMQIVEVSPRLEIDLSDYIESVSVNKSLDNSSSVVPISSINSNDASITISNIPINKSNLYIPLFSSQSNLNETILKNILRKNIKLYINFNLNQLDEDDKVIPGGIFYSDSWQENDLDTVTVQAYDISRYLQSTPVPDYVANLKSVFEIITNILDLAGFTDYDYDSLYEICNNKTSPFDLAYYYCNSKDKTIMAALSELFLAYQIGAYIDEYGIMQFLSLSDILSKDTNDITITDNDIIKDGYSISNNAKPGKISLRYQPPKVKQSPSIQNANNPKYKNSASFIYTTSNDVVWSQQNIDSVGYNYLSEDCLKNANKFEINVPSEYDLFHTYNLDANNFAAIEDEIISFAYKEYTISNGSGSVTVSVKNSIELQSEINKFIKKYSASLQTSTGSTAASYDVDVSPTGYITNVERGLFGTKIKDHKMLSTLSDKELSAATVTLTDTLSDGNFSYSISNSNSTTTPILNQATNKYSIKINPTANTKTLIYPTTDRDTGYKTYSTKFKFEDTGTSSAGLFFNLTSTSSINNTYFLELSRYALSVDSNGENVYRYLIALYYIEDELENIIAWIDITNVVNNILSNLPQVFVASAINEYANSYAVEVDESFNLRLSHYSSETGDGENVGELVSIFLNNIELVGWKIPNSSQSGVVTITGAVKTAGSITYTASNTFSVGDFVVVTGIVPSGYNIMGTITACNGSSFTIHYSSSDSWVSLVLDPYVTGGTASQYDIETGNGWTTTELNENTRLFKKICLPIAISNDTIYGSFSSTLSIGYTKKLPDNYMFIPTSTTTTSSYLNEIYACEKPLKQRSVNYYFQDKEFLNGIVQGYNLTNVKSFLMQTRPSVSGINYYDVQYTNPSAVSVDVLPIEYLYQYFPGDMPGDQKYMQQITVNDNSLSYSTPVNTGFRARMAIANSVPHLVFLNKDSSSTESATVRLNLWTHEIVAPSDQEIIEKVVDYSNLSEVAQIDSEWIQSKNAAYKTLNIVEKALEGFSKTTQLNIFGNPLLQVGDTILLTYTLAGINEQLHVIKSVSHSFDQGLSTTISLNKLSNGIAYSIPLTENTIVISPSITSLDSLDTQQFTAIEYDQYGNEMSIQPTFTWSVNSGEISSNGLYTPLSPYGNIEIQASDGQIHGLTEFNIDNSISYTVTYDEQGGSSVANSSYVENGSIALPSAPTQSGYTFLGWFTSSTGGTALSSPYSPSGTGNITLYAQWEEYLSTFVYSFDFETETPTSGSNDLITEFAAYDYVSAYPPNITYDESISYSGNKSMKVEWVPLQSYPLAYCAILPLALKSYGQNSDIDTISISARVYVPSGSPDVQLNISQGQYGATLDPPYITPYSSTSVKDQWVELTLNVNKSDFQSLNRSNYEFINIEPTQNTLGSGIVYVDSININVYMTPIQTYNITIDGQGGVPAFPNTNYVPGDPILPYIDSIETLNEGHYYNGLYTESTGGTLIDPLSYYIIQPPYGDVTFYFQWTAF